MNTAAQSHYSVEEITAILNIKPYLLRFWESEFEELGPLISDDGKRIYTPRDLSILKKIQHLLMVEKQSLYKAKALISHEFDLFGTTTATHSLLIEDSEEVEEVLFEENTIELDSYPVQEDQYETISHSLKIQAPQITAEVNPEVQEIVRPVLMEAKPEINAQTRLEIIKQNNAALTQAQQHQVNKVNMQAKSLELLSKASEILTHTKKSIHLFKLKLEVI